MFARTHDGVDVEFTHREGQLTLTFRRDGALVGQRVVDVREVDCNATIATARLMVELTLEELAFEEEARARDVDPPAPIATHTIDLTTPPQAAIPPRRREPEHALVRSEPSDEREHVSTSRVERPTFRLGTTADVGIGVALASYASVVASAVIDAAYAPSNGAVAPEISGRGGLFTSLPSRSQMEERDVWLSIVASRWDLCGGIRGDAFRARGCAGTIAGSMLAEGAESAAIVSLGARIEVAWQATNRTALLVAAEALSLQLPTRIDLVVEEWASPASEEVSPVSLMFSTGVTGDWLTL